jgi:hypothetical protein
MSDHGHTHEYPREIEEEPPVSPLTMEQATHQIFQLRLEFQKARFLSEEQAAGILREVGSLSGLVRNSEEARARDMRVLAAERKADKAWQAGVDKALGDLSEGQGRIAAELAARARQDSIHEEAITGVHKAVKATDAALDVTRRDLAVARAKWLGWRSLAAALGWGLLEALKHWIGG